MLRALLPSDLNIEEKRMMGGLTFMINGKMCVGILKEDLMARIDPEVHEDSLRRKRCREMDFTGRPMRGFVFVDPEGTSTVTRPPESDPSSCRKSCYRAPARIVGSERAEVCFSHISSEPELDHFIHFNIHHDGVETPMSTSPDSFSKGSSCCEST
jgi:hypothetical protein